MTASRCLIVLAALTALVGRPASADEVRLIDLRGKPLPLDVKPFGPDFETSIKETTEGVQFTLPKDRDNQKPVGLSFSVQLPGDFDVVASVQIIEAEVPK